MVDELARRDTGGLEHAAEAQLGQLPDRVREQVDAGANGVDAPRGLDELDLDPRVVQAQGGRQTADPAARYEQHRTGKGAKYTRANRPVRLIGTMASHLATALDNRRLLSRLRHDAYHDPLTRMLSQLVPRDRGR